jgi:putative transposase
MFKYRIYPSRKQKTRLIDSFKTCKTIYNELLNLSINNYKKTSKGLFKYDFNKYLTNKYSDIHSQVKQNISDRINKSFSNFFRRVKSKEKKKGFPRFKSSIKSITYPQSGFKFINEKRLSISKIGNLPIVLDRIPKGKVKTMTIKRNNSDQWFAIFSCEIEISKIVHSSKESVGIDVGIENFAVLSNGKVISNPRFLIKSENKLKKLHRKLSKKKKTSRNSFKTKLRLSKQYIKVTNQRTDFLHKSSTMIAKKYNAIAVENLRIKNMVKNHHLAKHIHDASWNSFIQMLSYKAVDCGGQLIKVDPRNTSKTCSNCGNMQEMPLSERTFKCLKCGFVCDRDLNASINHHDRAGLARISTPVGDTVRPEHFLEKSSPKTMKARVNEAGTIFRNST